MPGLPLNPYLEEEEEDPLLALVRAAERFQPQAEEEAAMPPPSAPPMHTGPDYSQTADRMEDDQKNFLGHELMEDPVARRIEAMRAMQAESPVEAPQASRRWEEEFLARNGQGISNRDLNQSWALGLFGGGQDFALQQRQQMLGQRREYEQGLERARQLDKEDTNSNRLAGDSVEQAIAASFGVDPKSLRGIRMDNPIVKAWQNGGYSQGLRERGQNIGIDKTVMNNETKLVTTELNNNSQEKRADAKNTTALETAKIRAEKKKGAGGSGGGPAVGAGAEAAYISRDANVPLSQAQAFVSGQLDTATADPKDVERMQVSRELFATLPTDEKYRAIKALQGVERNNLDLPIRQSNAPALVIKQRDEFNNVAIPFQAAYQGIKTLGPKLSIMTQFGTEGISDELKNKQLSPQEQAGAQALYQYMQAYAKGNFGTALTENEKQMLQNSTGVKYGSGVSIWSEPTKILSFMNTMKRILAKREKLLNSQLQQGY